MTSSFQYPIEDHDSAEGARPSTRDVARIDQMKAFIDEVRQTIREHKLHCDRRYCVGARAQSMLLNNPWIPLGLLFVALWSESESVDR